MNANDALFRETYPRVAPITAIRSTDTLEKIDYPLCGRPEAENHILFYTQFIVATYIKSNKSFSLPFVEEKKEQKRD